LQSDAATFQPGQTARAIQGQAIGGTLAETDEPSLVSLIHTVHATLDDGPGLGIILGRS
jgi:hypothetical protein